MPIEIEKTGIPLVQEAVTIAVHVLSSLSKRVPGGELDARDLKDVQDAARLLMEAEKVLYGR